MGASAEFWPDDRVKSISLEDISAPKAPPRQPAAITRFLGRMVHLAKIALMAWGVISLGAVVGMSVFYMGGRSDAPLLAVATMHAAPATETAAPVAERLAALIDAPLPLTMTAPPFSRKPPALPPVAAPAPSVAPPVATEPAAIVEARLPRARPDEPIITGSIAPAPAERAAAPRARHATLDPCRALKNLGAPFLFGNRCGPYTRVYPPRDFDRVTVYPAPPPHPYAPRPYQPPVVYPD